MVVFPASSDCCIATHEPLLGLGAGGVVLPGTFRQQEVVYKVMYHTPEAVEEVMRLMAPDFRHLQACINLGLGVTSVDLDLAKYGYGKPDARTTGPRQCIAVALPRASSTLLHKMHAGDINTSMYALSCFSKILIPLAGLHSMDWIHGDLKPSNVLETDDERLMLCDLGSMQKLDKSGFYQIKDLAKLHCTEGYFNPKIQDDGWRMSYKTDIYAMGVIMEEVLRGCPDANTDLWDLAAYCKGASPPTAQELLSTIRKRMGAA